jgi:hypothetical protein
MKKERIKGRNENMSNQPKIKRKKIFFIWNTKERERDKELKIGIKEERKINNNTKTICTLVRGIFTSRWRIKKGIQEQWEENNKRNEGRKKKFIFL